MNHNSSCLQVTTQWSCGTSEVWSSHSKSGKTCPTSSHSMLPHRYMLVFVTYFFLIFLCEKTWHDCVICIKCRCARHNFRVHRSMHYTVLCLWTFCQSCHSGISVAFRDEAPIFVGSSLVYVYLRIKCAQFWFHIIYITVIHSPPCSSTDVLFSPDDRLVVTGISVKKNEGKGKLLFMDRESLEILTELEVSDSVRTKNKDLFIAEKVYLNIH